MIIQELLEIQDRRGYLPAAELEALSARLGVPLHRLHEVASCFPHYRLTPPPRVAVRVCRDMACHLRGAAATTQNLEALAAEIGGGQVEVGGASCLGQCDAAPAVVIDHHVHRGKTIAQCRALVREAVQGRERPGIAPPAPRPGPGPGPGAPTGWEIDPYGGREDYAAVRRFVQDPDGDALIEALKVADLRGMGGAGVWAHQKWNDVRQARGDEKFVVCNGDESEPGTFKDRELLLRTPHLVLEGMILAALLVGARRGIVYIRHEYPEQIEAARAAIGRARALGVCGEKVLGTDRSVALEVFVSPGGYICGEQSALIEAIEDRRGEPRNKPPQLETNGLYDKPTLLSNVETFAWVPAIQVRGGRWYRDQGVNGAKGLRFFSISGDLNRPGAYEVPNGLTLRELIVDRAGGLRDGQKLKAVAPSGPSAGFLPAAIPLADLAPGFEKRAERFVQRRIPAGATHLDVLDLELDLQLFRDLGLMLGAGLVVYGDRANMIDQALNASKFYRNESCGKCVPCRIGSQRLVEIGARILGGRVDPGGLGDLEALVGELHQTLELTSICGLGMSAGKPLTTALRSFRQDLAPPLRPRAEPSQATATMTMTMLKPPPAPAPPVAPRPAAPRPAPARKPAVPKTPAPASPESSGLVFGEPSGGPENLEL
jgi:formate dehydrogenase beta subunit